MDKQNSQNNLLNGEIKNNDDQENHSIADLKAAVPVLNELFCIHKKVGEGTFSSVYLATLKSSDGSKKYALKHLIPTCHLERIERELQCLKQIGGTDHIAGIDLCLRSLGSVIFVMPYIKHDKFSEFVQNMSVQETKDYMRALLVALSRVHKFNVIHRDIKPSNFLYDRCNKRYLLIDFGLAQYYNKRALDNSCIQNKQTVHGTKRKKFDENDYCKSTKKFVECFCFGTPKVCSMCLTKPPENAPRAGTPGFRAPEVLLKYTSQTSAIDIWACGIILLCILSSTQPFFRSPDDCTALVEITTLFGSLKMQQCARKLGKKLIFSSDIPGTDIISVCKNLQERSRHTIKPITKYPKEAYHLLLKLLDLDYTTRITADQALDHPFLKE